MDRKEEGDHDHIMCIIRDTCLYFLKKMHKKNSIHTQMPIKISLVVRILKNPGVKIKRQNKYI